ncbi:MAG: 1-acyl-sn-glycerol-3-phosphate acyltransferase [Bacteroidales bacterium]
MDKETNDGRPIEIPRDFINIRRVFASKNPALSRLLPWFVMDYLRKIIHEDAINAVLYANRDKWGLDFVDAILQYFNAELVVVDKENIPENGRYVLISNHPLGGLDGIALMSVVGSVRKDIVFPVNDLLLNIPNMKDLFIPINKHGSNAANVRLINETFASDKLILYFPAGLVSRKRKGVIRDLEWKKTFVTKARRYDRDIIPVYMDGRNSNFFYNLANFRKWMGIRSNIEMLYLVNEMYHQRNRVIKMIFGKPVPIAELDRSKTDAYWAGYLKEKVYSLNPDKT